MKIRSLTCVTLLAAVFLFACKDSSNFTVSGTIANPGKDKKVYLLVTDSVGASVIDSATLNDKNEFQFKHPAAYASLYKLRVAGTFFDVIAKNGDDLEFKTDFADSTHAYEIKGSEPSEKLKDFNKIANLYGNKNSRLSDEYMAKSQALGRESDSLLKVYMPQFQKNIDDYSKEVVKFSDQNIESLAGFYAMTSLDQFKYEKELVAYADKIKGKFDDNPGVQAFLKQMEIARPISIGHKAPDFSTTGIDGKPVELSDYKGKYVMLDFWASWCAPCRQENPNVVKQYKKFKDKGFNILGISLDVKKGDWQSAINADGLKWQHASDLQSFEGPTQRLYHVEAIPSNFIIDPNGIIVAKNVTGSALEEFLNTTFN